MNKYLVFGIVLFLLIVTVSIIAIVMNRHQLLNENTNTDIQKFVATTSKERRKNYKGLEFKFCNLNMKPIQVWVDTSSIDPLKYITTVESNSCVYVYPNDIKYFKPGVIFFSRFKDDPEGEFVYKPYKLRDVDEIIYFGEMSTDFTHTKDTYSDRNEILSLHFENRSLKPYHIIYRGDYIGKLEGYHPQKDNILYTLHTNNDEKHFQLGTWLEFKMENSDGTLGESQFIQLRDKFTTDVHIGDVVGRTKGNA